MVKDRKISSELSRKYTNANRKRLKVENRDVNVP